MATSELPQLPPGVFDEALAEFGSLNQKHAVAMYNRHRAMFAESLIAALLTTWTPVINASSSSSLVTRAPT